MTPELLSPAGSPEAVIAAVQAGAGAVYLGYGVFHARRNAKNFSKEELAAAVSYCHLRGAKVYLTLNTLLTDRELPDGYQTAQEAAELGVDALLVQDLGMLRSLRRLAPELELHGSTQMSIHSLDGAKEAADLGLKRVVLARELSRRDIAHITRHAPIETEVFVHGALCMCHSGQCYLSAMVGGRSGNRGLCAQPCRLPYGWQNRADGYPLSLKDLCLAGHLSELADMGVASLKIEGRMKRPEYVSVVTRIYRTLLDERRAPTAEELSLLETVFSRDGFTDGYYQEQLGSDMFGVRETEGNLKELYQAERRRYEQEDRKIPVTMYAMIRADQPAGVGVQDEDGRVMRSFGPVPEPARSRPLTEEDIRTQLSKTGGTPFSVTDIQVLVEPDLSLPLSALNGLRRTVLEELSMERALRKRPAFAAYHPGARYENLRSSPELMLSLRLAAQVTHELLALRPAFLFLPPEELVKLSDLPERAAELGITLGITLPRICLDHERNLLLSAVQEAMSLGVRHAMLGNLGYLPLCRSLGLEMHGDFGLNVHNSQAVKQFKRMGLQSVTLSFELQLPQIRDIWKPLDCSLLVYGRLPLMVTENCVVTTHTDAAVCGEGHVLVDRKGMKFPLLPAFLSRNELLNSQTLFLADKRTDYERLGLRYARLLFTTESAAETLAITGRYLGNGNAAPAQFTRGLYYRGVK